MIMGFPWVNGVNVLIYLAGLQSIPQEIFDASRIDGAEGVNRFFRWTSRWSWARSSCC